MSIEQFCVQNDWLGEWVLHIKQSLFSFFLAEIVWYKKKYEPMTIQRTSSYIKSIRVQLNDFSRKYQIDMKFISCWRQFLRFHSNFNWLLVIATASFEREKRFHRISQYFNVMRWPMWLSTSWFSTKRNKVSYSW